MFDLSTLVRPNIKTLKPYSCAREEFSGETRIFLNANENNLGSPIELKLPVAINRYPESSQSELRKKIGFLRGVNLNRIFLGVGSDEIIDLLMRTFCVPSKDNIIVTPSTFGMYAVSASINQVAVKEALLTKDFQLEKEKILKSIDKKTKIIFLCSPNNPSGNLMKKEDMMEICRKFSGLVVVDEAYIEFADENGSMFDQLNCFPNLMILNTFSKAWGMAGLRMGVAYASEEIISLMMKIKMPYSINVMTSYIVDRALDEYEKMKEKAQEIILERERISTQLKNSSLVQKVYPSDANFLLVRFLDSSKVYKRLISQGILVRERSNEVGCENCLRITIGTAEENNQLLSVIKSLI
jgi:histidinol-phosphate aminotransferase